MKDIKNKLHKFGSLSAFHQIFGLPKPEHPLISFISIQDMQMPAETLPDYLVLDFYKIAYKDTVGRAKYGQGHYEFGEGGMVFTAPGQLFEKPKNINSRGFILLVHPDFLASYPLAKKVQHYGYFSYATDEALHLSEKEKKTIFAVFHIINEELDNRIDNFSHDVLISQIDLLLTYCDRFYRRQFITEKTLNNGLIEQFEHILHRYFKDEQPVRNGLPSVHYIADQLNVSASYLSDMLRSLTGLNTQQHIHNELIEHAKVILSTTDLSISEIAYQMGFEYPQSFSRLFKSKTSMSPAQYRQSFN